MTNIKLGIVRDDTDAVSLKIVDIRQLTRGLDGNRINEENIISLPCVNASSVNRKAHIVRKKTKRLDFLPCNRKRLFVRGVYR